MNKFRVIGQTEHYNSSAINCSGPSNKTGAHKYQNENQPEEPKHVWTCAVIIFLLSYIFNICKKKTWKVK